MDKRKMPNELENEKKHSRSPIAEPLVIYPGPSAEIFSTKDILAGGISGLGAQFRAEAHVYDERYFDVESKIRVITQALAVTGRTLPHDSLALDIGCGSGNATFAILELFDRSHVFSTDLSPEMLSILLRKAESERLKHRITAFVTDASKVLLKPESLDLVIGSSMVHHLVDPDAFIIKILGAVRSGGVAMFFEPFQAGHVFLRSLLLSLVAISDFRPGFSAQQLKFFKDYSHTVAVMVDPDRAEATTRRLDDKWMFNRRRFSDLGKRLGCQVNIFATNPPNRFFEIKIADLVFAGLGEVLAWPSWALDLVRQVDMTIAPDLREELLMEGCVVYGKN
jgi:SAM-dependent methyltransferase